MDQEDITLETLAKRLGRILGFDYNEAMWGLYVLLYGWRMKHHIIEGFTMTSRRDQAGEAYLTYGEAVLFSYYVGYDLTHD